MRNPDRGYPHDPGLRIHVHLGHTGAVGVGRRRPDAGAAILARALGRRVRSNRPHGALRGFRPLHGFGEGRAALPILRIEDAPARERQPLDGDVEFAPGMQREDLARSFGRLEGRVAAHESHPTRVAAEIDRREIGVGRDDRDVERIDAEYFSDDVGEN